MADNKKKITPEQANDIFARQLRKFKLTEEEQARAERLGLKDIDLAEIDPFGEELPFSVVNRLSLEECARMNDGSDYYQQVVYDGFTKYELAAYCLEELYSHIETGEIDHRMIDVNEKLLCFAENEELINAITCMGLQLSKYNQTQGEKDDVTNQPGTTGKMMNFHDSMATILSMLKEQDKDIQTTVANEIPLIEKEYEIIANLMYIYSGILDRVSTADKAGYEDNELYKAELAEIATDIVKTQYEFIADIYSKAAETVQNFIAQNMDDELYLDASGRYDPELSVFRLAKHVAFDDVDYALPGDEDRMVVLDILDPVNQVPELHKSFYKSLSEMDIISFIKTLPAAYEHEKESIIHTCEKKLEENKYNSQEAINCAEKIMLLDDEASYFMPVYKNTRSLKKFYSDCNANGEFYGELNSKLSRAKEDKKECPNGPGLASVPFKKKIGFVISAVLAVLALFTPLALIETGFEAAMKVVFAIIALVVILWSGAAAIYGLIFILPIFYFGFMIVLGIIQTFINPVLFVKLVMIGIPGAVAYLLYSEISLNLRTINSNHKKVVEYKNSYLPIAEKLLKICKERNTPGEMVTYYERMVEEFRKL